jgi:hypothetical protein
LRGLLVHPGDVIVADSDGVLSIPGALVEVAHDRAALRERLEQTIVEDARQGESGSRPQNFEIAPDLLSQLTGAVRRAGMTWADFASQSQDQVRS